MKDNKLYEKGQMTPAQYEAPRIELVEVDVEQGFANSPSFPNSWGEQNW